MIYLLHHDQKLALEVKKLELQILKKQVILPHVFIFHPIRKKHQIICKYFDTIKIRMKTQDSLDTEFQSSKIYSKKIETKAYKCQCVLNVTQFSSRGVGSAG